MLVISEADCISFEGADTTSPEPSVTWIGSENQKKKSSGTRRHVLVRWRMDITAANCGHLLQQLRHKSAHNQLQILVRYSSQKTQWSDVPTVATEKKRHKVRWR
jgi:hypothetical protein